MLACDGQHAAALGQGGVVPACLAGMPRLKRPDQPVKEAAPACRTLLEQRVHLRGEPDGGDARGDLGHAARLGAVKAEQAAVGGGARLGAGADSRGGAVLFDSGGHRPGTRPVAPGEVSHAAPAKTAARAEQGDGFQQIGLACAVRAGEHGDSGGGAPGQGGVGSEIGERQAGEGQHWGRLLIRNKAPCQAEHSRSPEKPAG